MTITGDSNQADPAADPRTLEELMQNLRGVQLYMIRMDMPHPVESPMDYLAPHLREHILWLEAQEKNGALFLSGANRAGDQWDGSGTAIIRAPSLAAAVAIAETEPFHREGLRVNTVHGWLLNEGTVRLTFSLFTDKFSLG
jgi:uncharacterized protein YciI